MVLSLSKIVASTTVVVASLFLSSVIALPRDLENSVSLDETRQIFEECTTYLERATGGLNKEDFASLVETLSKGTVRKPFCRLPLHYKAIFNTHACLNGKDCLLDKAKIPVSTKEERKFICATLHASMNQNSMLRRQEGSCEASTLGDETRKMYDVKQMHGVDVP